IRRCVAGAAFMAGPTDAGNVWHRAETVGAGISPSASLSDQEPVKATTFEEYRAIPALILTAPASRRTGRRPFGNHAGKSLAGLAAYHRRTFPAFMVASVRHRRWYA